MAAGGRVRASGHPDGRIGTGVQRCARFFFNDTATTEIYTLSLHDALPIFVSGADQVAVYLGIATMGQGHETTMAQICAQGLEIGRAHV